MLKFLKGFVYAFNGLVVFFRHERNGRIQILLALATVAAGWWLKASALEWILLVVCIGMVLALEMVNSAIEKLCNLVHPTYHPAVKTIKDISAAAVLWAAACSAVIAAIIFLPKLLQL